MSNEPFSKLPEVGTNWTHHSGRQYRVVMLTNLASQDHIKFPPSVVYEDASGEVWSRPVWDFLKNMTQNP